MRGNKALFVLFAFVLIVSLACAGSAAPTPTAVPTNTSVPTATPIPATPTAEQVKLELSTEQFVNSSGLFSFYPPAGWTLGEYEHDAYVYDETSGVSFYVGAINTGLQLDAVSFETFVNAFDNFYYAGAEGYEQTSYQSSDAKDVFIIEKTYTLEGKKYFVQSIYNQFGAAVFIFEFLSEDSVLKENPGYMDLFDEFFSKIEVNSEAVLSRPIYEITWAFVGPDNSMSINVPSGWAYTLDDKTTYSDAVIETLVSPDGAALIENISVVDGNTYTMGNAGEMALFLLNERYSSGGGDVRVSNIETLSDGSEFWTWKSSKGGYSGVTNFELRNGGTQVLLLSFVAYDATLEIYAPLFDRVFSSYTIP